jgi:hypothetical protein
MLLHLFVRALEINLPLEEYFPTTDGHELLKSLPQLDHQEGWITYLSHSNSKTVETVV